MSCFFLPFFLSSMKVFFLCVNVHIEYNKVFEWVNIFYFFLYNENFCN
jgi:hypothetical protein